MINPVKMVAKVATDKVAKMDMADLGKMAAGILMIAGGVVVLACGNVSMDEVNAAINPDTVIDVDANPVDATNVVVETVETVAETAAE